jgi:hypothetical protein
LAIGRLTLEREQHQRRGENATDAQVSTHTGTRDQGVSPSCLKDDLRMRLACVCRLSRSQSHAQISKLRRPVYREWPIFANLAESARQTR